MDILEKTSTNISFKILNIRKGVPYRPSNKLNRYLSLVFKHRQRHIDSGACLKIIWIVSEPTSIYNFFNCLTYQIACLQICLTPFLVVYYDTVWDSLMLPRPNTSALSYVFNQISLEFFLFFTLGFVFFYFFAAQS